MPCGFPSLGVPPLAPLLVDSYNIDIEYDTLRTSGVVQNVRVDGLNTFNVRRVDFGIVTLRVTFDIVIPAVHAAGRFNLNGEVRGIPFSGTGPFESTAFDVSMVGQARMGVSGGFLDLRDFDMTFLIPRFEFNFVGLTGENGETSDFFNPLFEQIIPQWIHANQVLISDEITTIVKPIANQILNGLTIADLLERLERGGEVTCVSPNINFGLF